MFQKNKLYIHIGTHKTGSTAIQRTLKHNQSELKKNNIFYLSIPKSAISLMNIERIDESIIKKSRKNLFSQIKKKKIDVNSSFIWSYEGVSGNPQNGYSNAQVIAESLYKISSGLDVYIIIYLRRQDDFIESLYTQMIHQGESYGFEEYIEKFTKDDFNWNNLVLAYNAFFPKQKIIVKQYGKTYFNGKNGILDDFSEIINKNIILTPLHNISLNRGYSQGALKVARLLNSHLDNFGKKELRKFLQKESPKRTFENYSYWEKGKRENLHKKYFTSNLKLVKSFIDESAHELFQHPINDNYDGDKTITTLEQFVILFGKKAFQDNEKRQFLNFKNATLYFKQKILRIIKK